MISETSASSWHSHHVMGKFSNAKILTTQAFFIICSVGTVSDIVTNIVNILWFLWVIKTKLSM